MATLTTTKEWDAIPFSDCLLKVHIGRGKQIKEKDYSKSGLYPVVDQGQSFIAGYTNDEKKVISDIQPFIIFGDHTRVLKYIDFPIALGADGTKVIKPKSDFDVKYFFYSLKYIDVPSRGYNRHYTILKEKNIAHPALTEQKAIAQTLTTVQNAITEQEKLVQKLKELKKSMMQHLFTFGTRGGKTKETEIGEMPESWELTTVKNAIERSIIEKPIDGNHGNIHPKSRDFVSEGIPFVMASNLVGNKVDIENCHFISKVQADKLQKGFSYEGDILLSHKATIGRTAVVHDLKTEYIMLTPQVTYYRVKDSKKLLNYFLRHFFDSSYFQKELKRIAGDGSTRAYIGILKQQILPIVLPPMSEQKEITEVLDAIDDKIELTEQKLSSYQELFKTLLHELMSGERRIKNI